MNREIKFRALYQWVNNGKTFQYTAPNHKLDIGKDWKRVTEWEQYTGKKDKNGTEIYDGDILYYTVFDMNDHDNQYKGVVKWIDCGFIVTQIPDDLNNGDYGLELGWVYAQDEEMEVIGNIHENPEILN